MAYQQQQQTKAVTVAGKAQQALDEAQIDPRLVMAAKAIQLMAGQDNDGYPKISGDMALAAAMYQAGTGQLLGRDFYVNEKVGRMEGYRGVARDANERGVGEVQIKYRPLTAQEAEDHEIQPGDTAVACEVYQLRAWNMAQRMGQRYEPITGIGVIRKVEKYDKKTTQRWDDGQRRYVQQPESNWRQATLEGGMTWHKKAQNRAYKDALRHTPGMPASPEEVIADAAASLDELPPETARLTMEQAQAWVEQHFSDDDATEAEFVEQPKAQPAVTGNGATAKPNGATQPAQAQAANGNGLPFAGTKRAAVDWAMQYAPQVWPVNEQGFIVRQVVERSFDNCQKTSGATGEALAHAWIAKIDDKLADYQRAQANRITDAELDGDTDTDPVTAGDFIETPLFS